MIFVIIAIKCVSKVFFWSLTNLHRKQQSGAAGGLRVGQIFKKLNSVNSSSFKSF